MPKLCKKTPRHLRLSRTKATAPSLLLSEIRILNTRDIAVEFRVDLPSFSGPLDLLLHLVKKQEVSVHEIKISKILEDYLGYVNTLESLDLNNIGEFLVMASTLMEIKSQELLPKQSLDLSEELDPRDELIQQLLEYRRYRELMRRLENEGKKREQLVSRGQFGADRKAIQDMAHEKYERELDESMDLEDLDVWFLLKAYARLLEETDFGKTYSVESEKKPLSAYIEELVHALETAKKLNFEDAFDRSEGKPGLIGTFMAILELMKQGIVKAVQEELFSVIWLYYVEEDDRVPIMDEEPLQREISSPVKDASASTAESQLERQSE